MQDGILQRFTVGAINAIGAKYLSRSDSSIVGLIGAGGQAGPQLAALKEVRPIQRVRVYSPTAGEAAAFAETMSASLKLEITVAQTPEEAIRGADIAVTATNSRVPFFPAQWLEPGMHLSCMQRDEAHDDCFARADVVVFQRVRRSVKRRFDSTFLQWKSSMDLSCAIILRAPLTEKRSHPGELVQER